ncbi:MAG: hypothetical protein ACLPUO_26140 [Streptosporangiaceae bacterium]
MHQEDPPQVRAHHCMLVRDIKRRPAVTRLAGGALNPLIGKSIVVVNATKSRLTPAVAAPYQ